MPIQATCPVCKKALRAPDSARGQQIVCPGCKTMFPVGAAVTAARPSGGAASAARRPRHAANDDAPPKKMSWLPIIAVAAGVLLLLCAGAGTLVVYAVYSAFVAAADHTKQRAAEILDRANHAPARPPDVAPTEGNTEPKQPQDAPKRAGVAPPADKPAEPTPPDTPKPADASRPPNADRPKPPDRPPPVTARPADKPKPPEPTVVQPAAASIPMECPPNNIAHILFSAAPADQALAVIRLGFGVNKVRLDRYDLAAGRKLDSVETAVDVLTRNYDFSPDGDLCLFDVGGSNNFSIVRLPEAKPLMSSWTVPPSRIVTGTNTEATVVAAYLLDNKRLLTVNGAAQVFVWSIPDGRPLKEHAPKGYAPRAVGGLLSGGATAISRDRKKLAVFNGADGFFVIDTATCKLDHVVKSPEDGKGSPDAVLYIAGLAFSPDGDQLAAGFHWQGLGGQASSATLVRWDLATQKIADRFTDPTGVEEKSSSQIGWWGPDYFWLSVNNGNVAVLSSWEKPGPLMKPTDRLLQRCRPYPGAPDGRLWYVTPGPDKQAVLKGVDFPADALKQAAQDPAQALTLTPDGVAKK